MPRSIAAWMVSMASCSAGAAPHPAADRPRAETDARRLQPGAGDLDRLHAHLPVEGMFGASPPGAGSLLSGHAHRRHSVSTTPESRHGFLARPVPRSPSAGHCSGRRAGASPTIPVEQAPALAAPDLARIAPPGRRHPSLTGFSSVPIVAGDGSPPTGDRAWGMKREHGRDRPEGDPVPWLPPQL